MVLLRVSLLWRIWLTFQHFCVYINGDVHEPFDRIENARPWQTFFERWIHNVPQFPTLRRVVPMFAQEPANEHEVVNVVLAVQVCKLIVKVADGLSFGPLRTHFLVIHVDFGGNCAQVFIVQIHPITEALDGSLESPKLDRVQLDCAFNFKREVFLGAGTLNRGHSITASAGSHFLIQIF